MTALAVPPPLQVLSMSSIQSGSRRQSARLQQKEDHVDPSTVATTNGHHNPVATTNTTTRVQTSASNPKKRKKNYDEEDDGFVFSRVKTKKPRQSVNSQPDPPVVAAPTPPISVLPPPPAEVVKEPVPTIKPKATKKSTATASETVHPQDEVPEAPIKKPKATKKAVPPALESTNLQDEEAQVPPKKRQKRRMSFSTPSAKEPKVLRRSKRLSTDPQPDQGSPSVKPPQELRPAKIRKEKVNKQRPPAQQQDVPPVQEPPQALPLAPPQTEDDAHSATKIALPFADTPVISRNKAMREGKSGKNERRSSLGLRGRRASSLIDSGTSNALPHAEVESQDFYKHIESDLLEPRRMRQLLTWCATRAMHAKPQGTSYAEASAKSVARVIEEELLKDIANKPELSEWFSREDDPAPAVPLPERPNPKNVSNAEKISELEEQIKRLRMEKDALDALKQPPSISSPYHFDEHTMDMDEDMLSEGDAKILNLLRANTGLPTALNSRVDKVITNLGPSIDTFADGIHKINQYRIGADQISNQVLSVCATKLAEREKEGRRKALGLDEDRSPGRDLSSVLRGLSKAGK